MTDEQLLAYYFVTDLGTKGVQAFMLKKTADNILNSLKENTIALKESRAPKPRAEQPARPQASSVEYTEDISEVVSERPKASKPKTNLDEQIEFFAEPEEVGVFSNLKDNGGFKEAFQEPDGMPEFGNADILAELERLSGEPEKPVRKTKVSKAPVKKPRTPRSKK
jgi:hypothetical protein